MNQAQKRLLGEAFKGEMGAFAKLLTWLEAGGAKAAFSIPEILNPPRTAFRCGITGPPGAGKSTLVSRLIRRLRDAGKRVGVVAVDPSSPFSGGAILGDRIRYSDHSLDPGVFVRSLGTRGSLGGLSASAHLILRAFDACGFDVVIVETVGVGQTELDVLHVADLVTVVLVPESGDSIQAMKAGLMEIADVFLVNKADRPGADSLVREIQIAVHAGESGKKPEVFPVIATQDTGLDPWTKLVLLSAESAAAEKNRRDPKRLQEEARALLRQQWEEGITKKLKSVQKPADLKRLFSR